MSSRSKERSNLTAAFNILLVASFRVNPGVIGVMWPSEDGAGAHPRWETWQRFLNLKFEVIP